MEKSAAIQAIEELLEAGFADFMAKELRAQGAMEPDWEPLESVLPYEWCGQFMFMGYSDEIRLYKNGFTRRYLNLDPNGKAYRYTPLSTYEELPLIEAIEYAFDDMPKRMRSKPFDEVAADERRRELAKQGISTLVIGPEGHEVFEADDVQGGDDD